MNGRRCLITGGARGMGRLAAEALAAQGARVILVDWQGEEGARVRDALNRRHGKAAAEFMYCDLSSLREVRALAQRLLQDGAALDVLLLNAGITYPERRLSEDGHEFHFAICHLAHYLLARLLLPLLERSGDGRIVFVSSEAHKSCKTVDFGDLDGARLWAGAAVSHPAGFRAYAQAKLCNVLTMRELHERLRADGGRVSVNALSPGFFVNTGIHREMRGIFRWGSALVFGLCGLLGIGWPSRAVRGHVHACTAPQLAGVSGRYFEQQSEKPMSPLADDAALRQELWRRSAALAGLPE